MATLIFNFILTVLATWRISHLLSKEDEPFDMIYLLRKKAGAGFFGSLLDCFYCVSVWVALPLGLCFGISWWEKLLYWGQFQGQPVCWNRQLQLIKIMARIYRSIKKTKKITMCNCGKKREEYGTSLSSTQSSYNDKDPVKNKSWDDVYFEYTGFTALSVKGSVSGRHYRFTQPGNTQAIDHRDAPAMMAVPVLRKVKRQ